MLRKAFRRILPSPESITNNRLLKRFGPRLSHPNLWHINRRSVAGGTAVGMFAGLIPGSNPVQFAAGAIGALLFKVNLPVAVFVTLYSNPFTILPLYFAAFWIGQLVMGGDSTLTLPPNLAFADLAGSTLAVINWFISLGKPLAVGLVCLGLCLAAVGYCVVELFWRIHVIVAWRRRKQRRAAAQHTA
ncbi:MAG: DUF2062 domain-containing protein [Burkholderiales bacterium]